MDHVRYTPSPYPSARQTEIQHKPDITICQERHGNKKKFTLEELKPYYTPKKLGFFSEALFECTLTYNKLKTVYHRHAEPGLSTWNPYDEVVDGIYLGRILEKENNPIPDDVGLIVSVCTYGELAAIKFPFSDFIESGGEHIFIHMVDFGADVSINSVIEAIEKMDDFLKNQFTPEKNKIYVHCKAGASRSASVVAAYDAYINDKSLDDSINDLKGKRVQVDVGAGKKDTFEGILNIAKTGKNTESDESILFESTTILASLEAKNRLRHLPSFKKLALYATNFDGTNRATYIQEFFAHIYSSGDASWYFNLNSDACLLNKFANATPILDAHLGFEDKTYRKKLVKDFKHEVENLAEVLLRLDRLR